MILNKRTVSLSLIAVFFVVLDRFLKMYALMVDNHFGLLGKYLKFNYVENYYIAFSLPLTGAFLSIFISCLVLALIFYLIKILKELKYFHSFLVFSIILGAMSNLFDRLRYGFVIDYFDLMYFTVFNIADIMISVSAFTLMFLIIKEDRESIKER